MRFDPDKKRRDLEELSIPMAREDDYAEAFQSGLLESYGNSILSTAVECLLLGLFDTGDELLRKARTFLRAAIEYKEVPRGGPDASEEYRLEGFAMCQWLLERKHELASLKEAVRWRENWFEETGNRDKTEVQLTLPNYLDAEEYDALFRRFDAAGIKPPKNLRQIKGEGTMCYVLARHRLGLEYSDDEVEAAVTSFLKRNMRSEWFNRGQRTTAALWMKLAFWKPGDDPIATLLRCYDFMPEFEPPQYPPPQKTESNDAHASLPLPRDYALVACWPPRPESIDALAERLFYLFDQFAGCDETLAHWYQTRRAGKKTAPGKLDTQSKDALVDLLNHGQKPKKPKPKDGQDVRYHLQLQNGFDNARQIKLQLTFAANAPRDVNRLEMQFPQGSTGLGSVARMNLVVASVARAFDPAWAGVFARELADPATLLPHQPLVDWIVYLCRDRCLHGTKVHYPGEICGLRSARLGAIFSSQPKPPDPAHPEHQHNIQHLRQAIRL